MQENNDEEPTVDYSEGQPSNLGDESNSNIKDSPLLMIEKPLNAQSESHQDSHPIDDNHLQPSDTDQKMIFVDGQALVEWSQQISFYIQSFAWAAFADDSGKVVEIGKGLIFVTVMGLICGLVIPPNESLNTDWYPYISSIIGYTYFVAWSISFYPQIILNYKRKQTDGLSVDLMILIVLGFAAYSAFNCAFFWSDSIKKDYADFHNGEEVLVQSNDVAFSLHALIMSIFTLGQIAYYDGFRKRPPSQLTIVFTGMSLLLASLYALFVWSLKMSPFTWVNFFYGLSYLKVVITCIKYFPQVHLNYSRKSTVGWNVWGVVLDFFGGLLSLLQLVFDSWNEHDFSGITGDITKLLLSVLSMFFDIVFLIQHYVLYPARDGNGLNLELEEHLLDENSDPKREITPETLFL